MTGASRRKRPGTDPDARRIARALGGVVDPELGLDVVTLGLIYDIRVRDGSAHIRHTLTTPGCPMEGVLRRSMRTAVAAVAGVERVELELVRVPRWNPRMIAEGAWQ